MLQQICDRRGGLPRGGVVLSLRLDDQATHETRHEVVDQGV